MWNVPKLLPVLIRLLNACQSLRWEMICQQGLICILLIMGAAKHLFVCLKTICVSSCVNCLFMSFANFSIWFFFPFPIFKCSLYIEKISPLFVTSFANHFPLACHLSLDSAYGSLALQKNIYLLWLNLLIFHASEFWGWEGLFLYTDLFSSRVHSFTFRSLVCLEFILMYSVNCGSTLIAPKITLRMPQCCLLKLHNMRLGDDCP